MTTVPPRSEIAEEYTWDTASVFPSDEAWKAEMERIVQSLQEIQRFQGMLAESAERLADWMEHYQTVMQRIGKVNVYASLFSTVDTADQEAQAKNNQTTGLHGRVKAATAFAEPEIIAIGADTLQQWIEEEPRLAQYEHYFGDLFRRQAHVRSAEVEEVLGMVTDPFYTSRSTAGILTNAEMEFEPAISSEGEELPIAQGNLDALVMHPDREVRRTAWQNYADGYLAFKNTLANNLTAAVKEDVFFARMRRYDSSLEAALDEDNIPTEVFYNLIETYKRHLPTWHRYWAVRKRALGYEILHPYDIKAPLTEEKPSIPYEQAVDWVCEGMAPLGEAYTDVMRRGCLEERWIDVYPNKGKRQGAFSSGSPGTHPFILMSYTDDLESMSTLAHELGHSMHSYLSWQNQPIIYSHYSMFVAEVASNFNQALVRAHLLETQTDPTFQIALIEEAMSNFHRYFFIMPALARFELEMHERVEHGEGITADGLINLMADLFQEGYGDEIEMDRERVGVTWAQFGHLYLNFYVFQYATGISGAHALAQRVLDGEPGAADDYLAFLNAGSSEYALDVLKRAGVDLTTPEPVETTFGVLAQFVDRLETLIEERKG